MKKRFLWATIAQYVPEWRNGRRARLKIWCQQWRSSSSLVSCNFFVQQLLVFQGVVFYVDEKGTQKGGNQWADWAHWAHWAVCGALFGSLLLKLWYSMALLQGISLPFAFLLVLALVSFGRVLETTLYLVLVDPMDLGPLLSIYLEVHEVLQ